MRDFLHRWEAMPGLKFAELIDGVVYVPSPVTSKHGRTESRVVTWLGTYVAGTPVCDTGSQSTWLMLESAPQPDCYLWIRPDLARLIQTVERGLQSARTLHSSKNSPRTSAEIVLWCVLRSRPCHAAEQRSQVVIPDHDLVRTCRVAPPRRTEREAALGGIDAELVGSIEPLLVDDEGRRAFGIPAIVGHEPERLDRVSARRDGTHPHRAHGDQAASQCGNNRRVPVRPVALVLTMQEQPLSQLVGRVAPDGLGKVVVHREAVRDASRMSTITGMRGLRAESAKTRPVRTAPENTNGIMYRIVAHSLGLPMARNAAMATSVKTQRTSVTKSAGRAGSSARRRIAIGQPDTSGRARMPGRSGK